MAETPGAPRLTDPLPHPGPQLTASGTPVPDTDHAEVDLFRRDRGAVGNLLEALLSENPYRLNFLKLIGAGALATFIFTACWYPIYFSYGNESTNLALILGAILSPREAAAIPGGALGPGLVALLIGIVIHLFVGIGIASAYAVVLLIIKQQSNAGKGMIFGILVGTGMMAFVLPFYLGLLARFHPAHLAFDNADVALNQIGTGNLGWGPMTVAILAHTAFGYVLGSFYRHKVSMDTVTDPSAFDGYNPAAGGVLQTAH